MKFFPYCIKEFDLVQEFINCMVSLKVCNIGSIIKDLILIKYIVIKERYDVLFDKLHGLENTPKPIYWWIRDDALWKIILYRGVLPNVIILIANIY